MSAFKWHWPCTFSPYLLVSIQLSYPYSILSIVDANVFASLTLLNREWRRISESPSLYAHHLSRCSSPSIARNANSSSVGVNNLATLKREFFGQMRRNTFEVFLRPRRTLIKLISSSISSSTAFPHGEALRFAFSPNSQVLLCLSSSRIFVLDVVSEPAVVTHELKTLRRPLGATVLDDGSLLAVISSRHQANIYSLSKQEAKHIQVLMLDDTPRTLTLSPTGGVLAIAYDDKIEVYALGKDAPAPQRRSVRCAGVDSICFSSDETMLLGSSADSEQNCIVTITAPFYAELGTDMSPQDVQIRMWTTQVLFPNAISGYSNACLVPSCIEGADSWIMAYDRQIGSFRTIRVIDSKDGVARFECPLPSDGSPESCSPATIPTTDSKGELAAVGFQDSVWLYGVPERFDSSPASLTLGSSEALTDNQNNNLSLSGYSPDEEAPVTADHSSEPAQVIIGRQKTLIRGHKIADIPGITEARWIRPTHSMPSGEFSLHRLVAVAPGGLSPPTLGDEDVPVDTGRVLILDFGRSARDGEMLEVNIELGESEPLMLREQSPSMEVEIELERTRSRLHRSGLSSRTNPSQHPSRSAVRNSYPATHGENQKLQNLGDNSYMQGTADDAGPDYAPSLVDMPYSNTQPRSHDTLRRAATAAATTYGRYNNRYRDQSGLEVPEENQEDNWVPPPPPYTREPVTPFPDGVRSGFLPSDTYPAWSNGNMLPRAGAAGSDRLNNAMQNLPYLQTSQRSNTITGSRMATAERSDLVEPAISAESSRRGLLQDHAQPLLVDRPGSHGSESQVQHQHFASGETLAEILSPVRISGSTFQAAPHNPTLSLPRLEPHDVVHQRSSHIYTAHHTYSLSSPDLPLPTTDDFPQDMVPQQTAGFAATFQGWAEPYSQYQENELLHPRIGSLRRRVSTDPTPSSLQQDPNEEWRRRIEEWNERTIRERSRRNRTRCVVM